jgi:hypothetical protein
MILDKTCFGILKTVREHMKAKSAGKISYYNNGV